jgi:hypothetical protein
MEVNGNADHHESGQDGQARGRYVANQRGCQCQQGQKQPADPNQRLHAVAQDLIPVAWLASGIVCLIAALRYGYPTALLLGLPNLWFLLLSYQMRRAQRLSGSPWDKPAVKTRQRR